jgi:chromosomal replication initiation ATPase DnaA
VSDVQSYQALWPFPRLIPIPPERLYPLPALDDIVRDVAARHGISPSQVRARYGPRCHAPAQQEAMWRCYATGRWSNGIIGRCFGGRDHTSVIHARQRHQARIDAEALGIAAE